LKENSFDIYDGVICVGGDGTFSEICFSVLLKTAENFNLDINDKDVQLIRPAIRLGVIPAGSTDAVAFGTTGHNDPITSTLQIITGQSISIDITTVRKICFFSIYLYLII
jgi:ceramide kinase